MFFLFLKMPTFHIPLWEGSGVWFVMMSTIKLKIKATNFAIFDSCCGESSYLFNSLRRLKRMEQVITRCIQVLDIFQLSYQLKALPVRFSIRCQPEQHSLLSEILNLNNSVIFSIIKTSYKFNTPNNANNKI